MSSSNAADSRTRDGSVPALGPEKRPGEAAETGGRTWRITTTCGCTASGYLPDWAEADPSETGVLLEELPTLLADMNHWARFLGQRLPVACDGEEGQETEVFRTSIDCNPYVGGPLPRMPVVNIKIVGNYWMHALSPPALAEVAAKLRAHAALLDDEVRPRLVAAREDWLARHAT
ncbi:DUF6907 domain-containing protein [Streptomyces sp. NPDC008079]|uniref:DUF6907 domain-containing protein n=1 Tax=unclassified Streptomyces TaxID=2593676 RepID=UPI0033B3653D